MKVKLISAHLDLGQITEVLLLWSAFFGQAIEAMKCLFLVFISFKLKTDIVRHTFSLKWHSFGYDAPPASDMMCEIWVMRASPAVALGVAPVGGLGERWWSPAPCLQQMQMSLQMGGTSCRGESWRPNSYNGIHWVAESLAPKRIPSMRKWESELVGGMWGRTTVWRGTLAMLHSLGISLQEWSVTYLQGMAIDTLLHKECEVTNWLQKNATQRLHHS